MHPFVRLFSLIVFASMLHWLPWWALLAIAVILAVLLWHFGGDHFFRLSKRARWLFLSMLVIYAFATPGEYVNALPEWMAPTYEGLREGLVQMLRLGLMLGAISVLLATTERGRLMAGLYLLLVPLRLLGVDPARFSARLWLTLHYVETMPKDVFHLLRQKGWRLGAVLQFEAAPPEVVQLWFPKFSLIDYVTLVSLVLMVGWLT
jgi:energy-coupling factor transport system permease protein